MPRAAIAADSPITAAAGARIAEEGGNAIDIAVASALTAAVAEPLMCSLGGSGFFMVRGPDANAELIEGADVVPSTKKDAQDFDSAWRVSKIPYGDGIEVMAGSAAVAVPGFLAAAETTWRKYGSLPWRELVQPAIEAAKRELPVSPTLAKWLSMSASPLFSQQLECRECFLVDQQRPLQVTDTFRIPKLDLTLEAIAEDGARIFYEGELGKTFSREIQSMGGLISDSDLANYQAQVRQPISVQSGGFELALNPPPAVGGSAVALLTNLIESNWRNSASNSESALLHARAQSRVLLARANQLAEDKLDFPAIENLLRGGNFADGAGLQSPNTTHFSVMTRDGGMAAVTMSMGYGAGVIVPSLGVCCNNGLGEPELNPDGYHKRKAGTRLVSNMAPTLAWHADGRRVSIGSPGASRITTSIAQTWARYAHEGMSCESAVRAPRLHVKSHFGKCLVQCEPEIDTTLLSKEFAVQPFDRQDMYFGAVKVAAIDRDGSLHAFADERRQGAVEFIG